MAGTIQKMLDRIIETRAGGNPALVDSTKCKLILKGLNPAKFGPTSPDDAAVIAKVRQAAAEFGITL